MLLFHQDVNHLPVKLDVEVLLPQLHQNVLFLGLVLMLKVPDFIRSIFKFVLLLGHDLPRGFQLLGHGCVLNFSVHNRVFLGAFFLDQPFGRLPLFLQLLLIQLLFCQLLLFLLHELLTTDDELVVELIHDLFELFLLFLLLIQNVLLLSQLVFNLLLVLVDARPLLSNPLYLLLLLSLDLLQPLPLGFFFLLRADLHLFTFAL